MKYLIYGVFVILHGLVHMWYVTLAQRWVPFEPEMGWNGTSWLLTNTIGEVATRTIATVSYTLITLAFGIAGVGVFAHTDWWPNLLTGAAIASTICILIFWDGSFSLIVQKGLLGFLINIALLSMLFIFKWPGS
jgi:hypothetical protein